MADAYPVDSPSRRRITAGMGRRSIYDSFLRYLAARGYAVPLSLLERDAGAPLLRHPELDEVLLAVYVDDTGPAQVCERLVDLDEGLQEWRYHHLKMVERTIGDKTGTGGSSGAEYLRSTLFQPMFPDLWAVRSRL
jgi:tryptophan 2,3-dioxygenase